MNLAAEGKYKIKPDGQILVVDAHGPFTEDITEQYLEDMYDACKALSGKPWGLLATFYGNSVFSPDAEAALIKMTKYRVEHGMIANASVIIDSNLADIQQMQLKRIYHACDVTFHVFADIHAAKSWLTDYVEQRTN